MFRQPKFFQNGGDRARAGQQKEGEHQADGHAVDYHRQEIHGFHDPQAEKSAVDYCRQKKGDGQCGKKARERQNADIEKSGSGFGSRPELYIVGQSRKLQFNSGNAAPGEERGIYHIQQRIDNDRTIEKQKRENHQQAAGSPALFCGECTQITHLPSVKPCTAPAEPHTRLCRWSLTAENLIVLILQALGNRLIALSHKKTLQFRVRNAHHIGIVHIGGDIVGYAASAGVAVHKGPHGS